MVMRYLLARRSNLRKTTLNRAIDLACSGRAYSGMEPKYFQLDIVAMKLIEMHRSASPDNH